MRILIDECLSPGLAQNAQEEGFEAYHLAHLGKSGSEDWDIARYAFEQDMILVTNNRTDFRDIYAQLGLHPGLVVIVPSVARQEQSRLFRAALERLRQRPELINKVLEADFHREELVIDIYDWPPNDC